MSKKLSTADLRALLAGITPTRDTYDQWEDGYESALRECRVPALLAEVIALREALADALATEQEHGQDWQPWASKARAALEGTQ